MDQAQRVYKETARALRKALACLLCAALVSSALPPATFALGEQPLPSAVTADQAVRFLEEINFFKGKDDPLHGYITDPDTGRLTHMGEIIYGYYSQGLKPEELRQELRRRQENPGQKTKFDDVLEERLDKFSKSIDSVRQSGESTQKKQEEAQKAVIELQKLQKGSANAIASSSPEAQDARMNAVFSGAALRDPLSYVRNTVDSPQGPITSFLDSKTGEVAFKTDKNNVIIYSKDLAAAQAAMNSPQRSLEVAGCAGNVDVTGRQNYGMLHYNDCILSADISNIEEDARAQRVTLMTQLLGRQPTEEQLKKENIKAYEKSLENERIRAGFRYGDWLNFLGGFNPLGAEKYQGIPVKERVDPKFAKRMEFIDRAKEELKRYREMSERYKGKDVILQDELKKLTEQESRVKLYTTLARLRSWGTQATMQLESLNWEVAPAKLEGVTALKPGDAAQNQQGQGRLALYQLEETPEAKRLRTSLERVGRIRGNKEELESQADALARQELRFLQMADILEKRLLKASPGADLSAEFQLVNAAQSLIQDIGKNYQAYASVAQQLNMMYQHNNGFKAAVLNLVAFMPNTVSMLWNSNFWGENRLTKWLPQDWFGEWRTGDFTAPVTYLAAHLWNGASHWIGQDWAGGYIHKRDQMDQYQAKYESAIDSFAQGNFHAAARSVADADKNAWETHMRVPVGSAGEEPNIGQKQQAVLTKAQEMLIGASKIHMGSGAVLNLLLWSAGIGLAGVLAGRLGGAAWMLGEAGQGSQAANRSEFLKALSTSKGFVGETLINTVVRLVNLGSAPGRFGHGPIFKGSGWNPFIIGGRFTSAWFVNSANTFKRLGPFAGSGAFIGTAFSLGMHGWHSLWGSESPFKSFGEAFLLGALGNAHWTMDSWHPLILFVNLPSSALTGTRLQRVADSLSQQGVVGNLASLVSEKWVENLNKFYGGGRWPRQMLAMADHVAKFQVLHMATGYLGYHLGYLTHTRREEDEDRRVRRAWDIARETQEFPFWMILPQFPAKMEILGEEARIAEEGVKRLIAQAEKDATGKELEKLVPKLVGAGHSEMEGSVPIEVDFVARPVWQSVIFGAGGRWFGPSKNKGKLEVKVPKHLWEKFIRDHKAEIVKDATGEDPAKNPLAYIQASLRDPEDRSHFGRVEFSRYSAVDAELRVILAEEGGKALLDSPNARANVLEVEPLGGSTREVVLHKDRGLIEAVQEAKIGQQLEIDGRRRFVTEDLKHEMNWALYDAHSKKMKVPESQYEAAKADLADYINSKDRMADLAWSEREAIMALDRGNVSGKFNELTQLMLDRSVQWKEAQGKNDYPDAKKTYMEILDGLDIKVRQAFVEGNVSPREHAALESVIKYMQGTHNDRFNYLNVSGRFRARVEERFDGLRRKYLAECHEAGAAPDSKVLQELGQARGGRSGTDTLQGKVLRFLDEHRKDERQPVWNDQQKESDPASFQHLLKEIQTHVGDMKKAHPQAASIFEEAGKAVESGLWLLRDSKGTNLRGWKPEQFEALMQFQSTLLMSWREDFIRAYLQVKTSAGKTLLSFAGLLPIAQAEARALGKTAIFLTVQSNLEAQAKLELRSLKILRTERDAKNNVGPLEVDTWENFKSKRAQGKLQQKGSADEYWIMADEMDAAALQPALTIGEERAKILREGEGQRRLSEISEDIATRLNQGPKELKEHFESLLRLQDIWLKALRSSEAAELGQITQRLRSSFGRVEQLLTTARGSDSATQAAHELKLSRQMGKIRSLLDEHRDFLARAAQESRSLADMAPELVGRIRDASAALDSSAERILRAASVQQAEDARNGVEAILRGRGRNAAGGKSERELGVVGLLDQVDHGSSGSNQARSLHRDAQSLLARLQQEPKAAHKARLRDVIGLGEEMAARLEAQAQAVKSSGVNEAVEQKVRDIVGGTAKKGARGEQEAIVDLAGGRSKPIGRELERSKQDVLESLREFKARGRSRVAAAELADKLQAHAALVRESARKVLVSEVQALSAKLRDGLGQGAASKRGEALTNLTKLNGDMRESITDAEGFARGSDAPQAGKAILKLLGAEPHLLRVTPLSSENMRSNFSFMAQEARSQAAGMRKLAEEARGQGQKALARRLESAAGKMEKEAGLLGAGSDRLRSAYFAEDSSRGFSADDVKARNVGEFVHERDLRKARSALDKDVRSMAETRLSVLELELRARVGASEAATAAAIAKKMGGKGDAATALEEAAAELGSALGTDARAAAAARELKSWAGRLTEPGLKARAELRRIHELISGEVAAGKSGWQDRVRQLLAERKPLVEDAATGKNPIYELYQQQLKDVTGITKYALRAVEGGEEAEMTFRQMLQKAPQRTQKALDQYADFLEHNGKAEEGARLRAMGKAMRQALQAEPEQALQETALARLRRMKANRALEDDPQSPLLREKAEAAEKDYQDGKKYAGSIDPVARKIVDDPARAAKFKELIETKRLLKRQKDAALTSEDNIDIQREAAQTTLRARRLESELNVLDRALAQQARAQALQDATIEVLRAQAAKKQFAQDQTPERAPSVDVAQREAQVNSALAEAGQKLDAVRLMDKMPDLPGYYALRATRQAALTMRSAATQTVEYRKARGELLAALKEAQNNPSDRAIKEHVEKTSAQFDAVREKLGLDLLEQKAGIVNARLASSSPRSVNYEVDFLANILAATQFQPRLAALREQGAKAQEELAALTALEQQARLLAYNPTQARMMAQRQLDKLSARYTQELARAFADDVFLPPMVRMEMCYTVNPVGLRMANWARSAVLRLPGATQLKNWTRSPGAGKLKNGARVVFGWLEQRGSATVQQELLSLAQGRFDNYGNIRYNGLTGAVVPIHNGEWSETMDTPTRRYWEIQYESDLTLPYKHREIVTVKDFIEDPYVRMVAFSGTIGKILGNYMRTNRFPIVGKGSSGAAHVPVDVFESPAAKLQSIGMAVRRGVMNPQGDSLVVLSLPDTRTVRIVKSYLTRAGILDKDEIASVFSDAIRLSTARPQANVEKQMNLAGLNTGKVRVLMLDTRVGGRGLDLNFKGDRGNTAKDAFKGYRDFQMLIVDPYSISVVHNIQAQGRIDLGRVHAGSNREFRQVIDIRSAQQDPVFMRMMLENPLLRQMADNPPRGLRDFLHGKGAEKRLQEGLNWADIHSYIYSLGAASRVAVEYYKAVAKYIRLRQDMVEREQLQSSSVLQHGPPGGAETPVPLK